MHKLLAIHSEEYKTITYIEPNTVFGTLISKVDKDKTILRHHIIEYLDKSTGEVCRLNGGQFVRRKFVEQIECNMIHKSMFNMSYTILGLPLVDTKKIKSYEHNGNIDTIELVDGTKIVVSDGKLVVTDDVPIETVIETEKAVVETEETEEAVVETVVETEKAVVETEETVVDTKEAVEVVVEAVEAVVETVIEPEETVVKTEETVIESEEAVVESKETVIETEETDGLSEFREILNENNSVSIETLAGIKLIGHNWESGITDDYIESISKEYDTDTDEIKVEKTRLRQLLKFKRDIESTLSVSKDSTFDYIEETEELEETEDNTEESRENLENTSDNEVANDKNNKVKEEKLGDRYCPICHGDGTYINPKFGLITVCSCVEQAKKKREAEQLRLSKITKIKIQATNGEYNTAIKDGLIPSDRQGDIFTLETLDARAIGLCKEYNIQLGGPTYKKYTSTLSSINVALGSGSGLKYSYIISAPNGFSKTTFANSCIANLSGKGKPMVPYKALSEIARLILVDTENYRNLRSRRFDKIIRKKENEYNWEDYCNAYVVFCFLTIPEYAEVELSALKALLSIRGNAGLATVVFTERPINAYNVSKDVGLYLLSDMITSVESNARLDRPYRVEVKRVFASSISLKSGKDI